MIPDPEKTLLRGLVRATGLLGLGENEETEVTGLLVVECVPPGAYVASLVLTDEGLWVYRTNEDSRRDVVLSLASPDLVSRLRRALEGFMRRSRSRGV